MRYNLNLIATEVAEIANEKKQRELDRKQDKLLAEFNEEIVQLMYHDIKSSLSNGATLGEIYQAREQIISGTLENIKAETIEVEDIDSMDWRKTKTIRKYPYYDYFITKAIEEAFIKEYNKAKKRIAEEDGIQKKELKKRLANYFINTFEDGIQKGAYLYNVYENLKLNYYKNITIQELSFSDQESLNLEEFYYKTLGEVIKGYNLARPPTLKKEPKAKSQKLALPWRIIAGYKLLGKLWKS